MSDTTTITPEERARLREQADKSYLLPLDEDEVPSVGFDGLTDDRIAYIAAACNSVPRLLAALDAAEARAEKAEAEVDWLAKVCAMHCRDKSTDDSQCNISDCGPVHCRHASADQWTEAARRAVAAGEGE